jgi:hypothetical protein
VLIYADFEHKPKRLALLISVDAFRRCYMNSTLFMSLVSPFKLLMAATLGFVLVTCGGDIGEDLADHDIGQTTQEVLMSGEQEVPPVSTGALGTAKLTLDLPSRSISGSIVLNGMTANAAHIHEGDVGVNGPIIVPLTETAPGTWSVPEGSRLTTSQAEAFATGGLYVNAHSAANPNGEIRGQIRREVFTAQMSAAQEVPPPISHATGTGLLSFDSVTRQFTARITVAGMTATAAHIHTGEIGVNGPITFPLTETPAGSGIWVSASDAKLSEAELTTLRAGGMYFNAHSVAFPNGEIRGQIGRSVGFASLTGAVETPPNSSSAAGTGTLVVNPTTRAASGSITLSGMAATMAHIHLGAPGVAGPIIIPLTQTAGNVWSVPPNTILTAEWLAAYKQGNLYYNAHSVLFPAGEIRGQIR